MICYFSPLFSYVLYNTRRMDNGWRIAHYTCDARQIGLSIMVYCDGEEEDGVMWWAPRLCRRRRGGAIASQGDDASHTFFYWILVASQQVSCAYLARREGEKNSRLTAWRLVMSFWRFDQPWLILVLSPLITGRSPKVSEERGHYFFLLLSFMSIQ